MKCLITDAVYPGIEEELSKYMVCTNTAGKPLSKAEMIEAIGDVDILIMRVDPKIDEDILNAAKNLKIIGVCAVGTNHIDLNVAKEKGIQVYNAPGMNANAVAELTISKMLDMARNTMAANYDVKHNHVWDKYNWVGRELRGKTLGIMGFGRIGRRVGELGRAFLMDVVAYDPFLKPADFTLGGAKGMSIDELIRVSDFISIHVPLTPDTRNLFNKKSIAEILKDEGYINGFEVKEDGKQGVIDIEMKYGPENEKVITGIKKISKPGLKVYAKANEVPRVLGGLGIAIISTSNGVISDKKARELGVGGEVICYVW